MNKDFIDTLIDNASKGTSDKWQWFRTRSKDEMNSWLRISISAQKSGEFHSMINGLTYTFPGIGELMTDELFNKNKLRLVHDGIFFLEAHDGACISKVWLKYE